MSRRKTIAVLVDYMDLFVGGYETELRAAFDRSCRHFDFELMMVYGRAINHPDSWLAAHNSVYELIDSNIADGLVATSASLGAVIGVEGLRRFLERYDSMALCSYGLVLPGVPSVVADNRVGMSAVIEHLVLRHGIRRVAYVGGTPDNVDAQERFAVFREVLRKHDLSFDEQLVAHGDFERRSGYLAMRRILDNNTEPPKAVVAANDGMALGAISALRERGLRVPRDVAVTGFDDLVMSRLGDPPLTTVAQPLASMASASIELIARILAGERVPECTILPTTFLARQSCGCNSRAVRHESGTLTLKAAPSRALLLQRLRQIQETLAEPGQEGSSLRDIRRLLVALERELSTPGDHFMVAVEELVVEAAGDNERYQLLQVSISRVREDLRIVMIAEVEDLLSDAKSYIALSNTRSQAQQRYELDAAYHRLLEHGERISTALDVSSLAIALTSALPMIGITRAHISHYTEANSSKLETLVCLPSSGSNDTAKPNPLQLPALDEAGEAPGFTKLVFPLAYENQALGVAVFQYTFGYNGYQMVRDQVSAALRSVALHEEIIEKKTLHERRIQEQERLATAKRIQSLSVLAGGVAHDLNNVLGPLVALPEVILDELDRYSRLYGVPSPEMREDVQTIQSAAERAAQTIKDLLTLGRQGRAAKQSLDLNQAIAEWFATDPLHGARGNSRKSNVRLGLHPEPLHILGSTPHLIRALANLVHNAIEAIGDDGHVKVETRRTRIEQPMSGYETIEPGEYATITVADTGAGIPAADLARVFEPFFSSKKLGDQSGSGLGLAIVHGVVKEHDGYVNVESSPGFGTAFSLYLPIAAHRPVVTTIRKPAPRGRAKILVVDDEPVQLRTARRVLTHLGYEVETLASGKKALSSFRDAPPTSGSNASSSPYDLIILDMLLNEEFDGLHIFEEIERLYPFQKAILVSGHASSDRAELARNRGLTWLMKPYTTEALGRAVQSVLEGRPTTPPQARQNSSVPSM